MNKVTAPRADFSEAMIHAALKRHFGFDTFRPRQLEAVTAILKGEDVFVNLATSGGKSLTYQLPGLMLPGVTLVVTPLIALMRDQTQSLSKQGLPVGSYHSGMSDDERKVQLKRLGRGEFKLFYLSPEALQTLTVQRVLQTITVALIAIDEAHCISQWGHTFKPAYLKIPDACAVIGRPPMMALTATAPVLVRNDVLTSLGIPNATMILGDIDRPNLTMRVEHFLSDMEKEDALFAKLKEHGKRGESAIVYCGRVATVERLARAAAGHMIRAIGYHGRMEGDERKRVEQQFMSDAAPFLIATNAFGMGVDKRNIRAVYHFELPTSLEAYWQEAGRGGRDGLPATCTLLVHPYDARTVHRWVDAENPSLEMVRKTFEILCKFFKSAETEPVPLTTSFAFDKFVQGPGDSQWMRAKTATALTTLEEAGLISFSGRSLTLLKRPSEVQGENFPVTSEMIRAKRLRDEQKCAVMLWFASQDTGHRELIINHFRDNSVIDQVDHTEFERFYALDEEILEAFLKALDAREYEEGDFTRLLSTSGSMRSTKRALAGELKNYTTAELRLEVANAASMGYIRKFSSGRSTYMTITEQGIEFLKTKGHVASCPKSEPELLTRLHHPTTKRQLIEAIKTWYDAESRGVRSENRWWEIAEDFMMQSFTVGSVKVSGRKLAMGFARDKKVATVRKTSAKNLLEFLFPNAFQLG